MAIRLRVSQILSPTLRRFSHQIVGYLTPQGRVFCPACATSKGAMGESEPYSADGWTDWSITCEQCEEILLEPDAERQQ
jgi:hypothetical protein